MSESSIWLTLMGTVIILIEPTLAGIYVTKHGQEVEVAHSAQASPVRELLHV